MPKVAKGAGEVQGVVEIAERGARPPPPPPDAGVPSPPGTGSRRRSYRRRHADDQIVPILSPQSDRLVVRSRSPFRRHPCRCCRRCREGNPCPPAGNARSAVVEDVFRHFADVLRFQARRASPDTSRDRHGTRPGRRRSLSSSNVIVARSSRSASAATSGENIAG